MGLLLSVLFNTLREIADSLNLELSSFMNQVSTQYTNNSQELNSVLDLMFLCENMEEFSNHIISPDLWSLLDHTLLSICIIIEKKFIQEKKQAMLRIVKKKENLSTNWETE